jgi:hypothetical protein
VEELGAEDLEVCSSADPAVLPPTVVVVLAAEDLEAEDLEVSPKAAAAAVLPPFLARVEAVALLVVDTSACCLEPVQTRSQPLPIAVCMVAALSLEG